MGANERNLYLPVESLDESLLNNPVTLPTQAELDAPVFSCASIVPSHISERSPSSSSTR